MYAKLLSAALLTAGILISCSPEGSQSVAQNKKPQSSFTFQSGSLIATSVDDGGTSGLTYQWAIDGVPAGTSKVLDTSSLTGLVTIKLTTTDSSGLSHVFEQDIPFGVSSNQPPVAVASATVTQGVAPLMVTFNGGNSTDDGSINLYSWSIEGQTKTGASITHNFSSAGSYDAVLTVTDDGGLSKSDRVTINVTDSNNAVDAPPKAVASANTTQGSAPLAVVLSALLSTDDNLITQYTWNVANQSYDTAIANHTFNVAGNYAAQLTVEDASGQTSVDTVNIIVTSATVDLSPVAAFSTNISSGDAPLSVSFDASGSMDDKGIASYSWNFGDGASASTQNPVHVYSSTGVYDVVLTVTDTANQQTTQTTQITVTRANAAPTAVIEHNVSDLTVNVSGAMSSDDQDTVLIYEWNFNGEIVKSGSTSSHTFSSSGAKVITLTVEDSKGLKGTATVTVQVQGATNTQTDTDTQISPPMGACSDNSLDFCTDFEDGMLPNALQAAGNYDFDNIGYKSNQSVKVNAGSGNFFKVVPPSSDFWARVFIRSNGDSNGFGFGGNNQGFARAHGVLLKGTEGGAQMRVGDHRCQLEINRDGGNGHLGDDLEMTSGSYGDNNSVCNETFGARMEVNQWYCLEVHFNGPDSEVQVFWDNQNVEQLHVTASRTWTNADKPPGGQYSMNADKLWGPYNYDYFEFGYESFNNGGVPNNTFWYDNVAVSTSRIGCGSDYVINSQLDDSTKLQPNSNGYPYTDDNTQTDSATSTQTDTNTDTQTGTNGWIKHETFESSTVGNVPAGWSVWADYNTKHNVTTESGIEVVDSGAQEGNKALKVTGANNFNRKLAMFRLPENLDKVYVKAQVKFATSVGGRGQNQSNHNHFFALKNHDSQNTQNDAKHEVRFGEIKGVLGVNEWINSGDGLYPHGSEWGPNANIPTISANQWHCMEFALENDGAKSVFEAKLNGVSVTSFSGAAFHNNSQGDKWLDNMFGYVALGWDSYGTYANEVWFDDVVISTVPVSCN